MHSDGVRWRTLAAVTLAVLALTAGIGALAASVPAPDPSAAANDTAPPSGTVPYASAHAAGYTGENVSVGIVDVTGFDADDPRIARQVEAARSFGGGTEGAGHGTAAASVVARAAPDANLSLATFDTPEGYRQAMAWLVRRDVDVILSPVSFYGTPDDGTAGVSEAAARATEAGVTVVAPAGNLAAGHWEGAYRDVENGTLRFAGGYRNELVGDAPRATLWLSWDDPDERYTVELYRETTEGSRLVAVSQPYPGDGTPNARIVARVGDGSYFAVVRGPRNATNTTLELTSPTHELGYARPQGSVVAPATAPGVFAVGAYNRSMGIVAPYSSRGPTADGRPGVDAVARARWPTPDGSFVGSSAAAAYAAGSAALVLDADPGRSPAAVKRALTETAADTAAPGRDPAAGHGRIRPWRAVRYAANATG